MIPKLCLMCDRDEGRILKFDKDFEYSVILDGLNHPHGLHITQDYIVVSQQGELERWNRVGWDTNKTNKTTLVDNVPTGNHQPNAVNALENGTLLQDGTLVLRYMDNVCRRG